MLNIKPHERTSNPGRSAPAADMTAAAQRIQFALGKAAQLFADLGGTDDLAEMFQEDALSAEVTFKGNLLGMGCDILGKLLKIWTNLVRLWTSKAKSTVKAYSQMATR